MKKLRLAVIGQGRSGRNIHGEFYRSEANDLFEVAAVVEADHRRRERAKEEYPGCEVFADYRDLFDRTDLDLVVNASYSHMHYPITKELLQHGFNVLVEKPFARNYYECSDLMRTAEKNGVVLAVFQQTFYAPFYTETKKILETGKLGDIKQVSIRYNNFARRWDWQTLQCKMAGHAYNTGPHPIGLGLDFLDFDEHAQVAFSRLNHVMVSGDAEGYAKMILTAPNKPVVDIEINSTDAFQSYNLKIQGSRGTYVCNQTDYKMKYIVEGENPEQPVVAEFLQDEEGYPIYCREKLVAHEEQGTFEGSVFTLGTERFYRMLHNTLTTGAPLEISAEHASRIIGVIETVHAQNPMPVKF